MDTTILILNIKALCTLQGISVTSACVKSGVGKSFISDIQRGRTPAFTKVQALAEYLGVTTSDLLGEEKEPATISSDGLPAEILDLLKRVPADRWPEVERYLRFQAESEEKS